MKPERQLQEAETSLEWLWKKTIDSRNSPSFQRYYKMMIEQEVIVDELREEVDKILTDKK